MADKAIISSYPYGVAQYYYTVEICRTNFPTDPCSDDKRFHSGL